MNQYCMAGFRCTLVVLALGLASHISLAQHAKDGG